MGKFTKKKSGELPAVNTASLPDIVFMLLFFFMVATVMRQNTLMIQNQLPFADQVEKLDKKDLVMYIYAGKPSPRYQQKFGTEARIQLNDSCERGGERFHRGASARVQEEAPARGALRRIHSRPAGFRGATRRRSLASP